ncbi:MAG TPA: hypothetical protein VGM63_14390, partial [Mucilaginibacter sp.]
ATADLNLDTYSAAVTLKDHAKVTLSGNAAEFNLNQAVGSEVAAANFVAAHQNEAKTVISAQAKNDDLIGLE